VIAQNFPISRVRNRGTVLKVIPKRCLSRLNKGRGSCQTRGILGAFHRGASRIAGRSSCAAPRSNPLDASLGRARDSGKNYRVIYAPSGGTRWLRRDIQSSRRLALLLAASSTTAPPHRTTPAIDAEIAEKSSPRRFTTRHDHYRMVAGHEVKLAFPLVFPDPPIPRPKLPQGLQET